MNMLRPADSSRCGLCHASAARALAAGPRAGGRLRADLARLGEPSPGLPTTSRPTTPMTPRSPATGGSSPSTARSEGAPASGGAICRRGAVSAVAAEDPFDRRSVPPTPSCRRSAKTAATSASRRRHASIRRRCQSRPGRVRARHGPGHRAKRVPYELGVGGRRIGRRADLPADGQVSSIEAEETPLRLGCRGALGTQRRWPQGGVRDDRDLQPRRARYACIAGGRARSRHGTHGTRQRRGRPCARAAAARPTGVRPRKRTSPTAPYTRSPGAPPFVQPAPPPYEPASVVGASISADGSTVAWMGVDIAQQAKLLSGEAPLDKYTEPLWRRIGDGPTAPTRRITGGSDPADPACAASGETSLSSAALRRQTHARGHSPPRRKAGRASGEAAEVSRPEAQRRRLQRRLLANAPLVSQGPGVSEPKSDVYLVNMHAGLTRDAALRPLTELAGGDQQNLAENGPVEDVGHLARRAAHRVHDQAHGVPARLAGIRECSGDGGGDARAVRRGPERRHAHAGHRGLRGGPSEHPHHLCRPDRTRTRIRATGRCRRRSRTTASTLAFSSTASNLVFGDGNTPPLGSEGFDGGDVFVGLARDLQSAADAAVDLRCAARAAEPRCVAARATARSRADGSVLLYVDRSGRGHRRRRRQRRSAVRTRRHGRVQHKRRDAQTSHARTSSRCTARRSC